MKFNLKYIALLACTLLALTGCKKEDLSRQHYENKLYISTTSFTEELLVKATAGDFSRELKVGIAKPVAHDINARFKAAPELLETYRAAYYDQNAVLLPDSNYVMEAPDTKIQAGGVASTPVKIDFVNVAELDRDLRYVLPVTLASVEGIDALESARTVYYIFKGAALINVVVDLSGNKAWPDWVNSDPVRYMSTFTLEALINATELNKEISTIMGIEGKFLVRIGDAGVPKNQIQIASSRNITTSDLQIETGKWYHLAVTFNRGGVEVYLNGVLKLSGNVGASSVNIGVEHSNESNGAPRCFWIGYSYNDDRSFEGRMSEVRIWNRALTADEINAPVHFYGVDPASPGLVAYWKLDDGAGAMAKDYTSYGNNLTIGNLPQWPSVSLPEKQK